MTGPLQRRAIADGVWFSRIHDPKFYHNSISVTIITPLAEGKTSAAVLAAYLLRMGSRRCRDMTELECRAGRGEHQPGLRRAVGRNTAGAEGGGRCLPRGGLPAGAAVPY